MIFDWDYRNKELVHLLWVAFAVTGGLAFLELRSRDALASFLSPVMQRRLTAKASVERTLVRLVLIFGCLAFGVGALMRPQATNETESALAGDKAADVMFVLDVSRSMLAEDATPNRLARAKSSIAQLVAGLEGQRVGLVVFAGRATPVCPLTPDHSFFNTVLNSVDTQSTGRGGTKVGEAIKVALRGFPPSGARMIVLITDGDDQDPYTKDAAQLALEQNVKIVAIGFGSETGSQITLTDPKTGAKAPLMHDGKPVISKLDGATLRDLAKTTHGAYIPAGTSAVDLDDIRKTHIEPMVAEAAASATRQVKAERYPWMVLGALLCLLAALWVGSGAGDSRRSA